MGSQRIRHGLGTRRDLPSSSPGGGAGSEGWLEGPPGLSTPCRAPPGAVPSERSSAVLEALSQPHLEGGVIRKECSTSPQAMDGSTQRPGLPLLSRQQSLGLRQLAARGASEARHFSCLCPGTRRLQCPGDGMERLPTEFRVSLIWTAGCGRPTKLRNLRPFPNHPLNHPCPLHTLGEPPLLTTNSPEVRPPPSWRGQGHKLSQW